MARVELISTTEAAKRKGCTRQAVHLAATSGKLDAEQVGRSYVVRANKVFENWTPNPKRQVAGGIRRKRVKKAKRTK